MKTLRFLLSALAILCLLPVGSAQAGAEVIHVGGQFEIDEILYNECNDEYVHLTGTMVWNGQLVQTSPGVYKWGFQENYQGVSGVGLTSGITYRGVSGNHGYGTTIEGDKLPYHYAAGGNNKLLLIAKGKAPDLIERNQVHVTVTPDFRFVVEIFDHTLVCK